MLFAVVFFARPCLEKRAHERSATDRGLVARLWTALEVARFYGLPRGGASREKLALRVALVAGIIVWFGFGTL